ncbi:MAG: hypothetical protein RBS73_11295 [Prolixibacteraceae bacterium]|jgi:hypothetical protein|nr:hypothetical protein [Prolixibacteraceae bacterium]
MNYIKHLNGFFERVSGDGKLTAYHISLYLALFQLWNLNRFSEKFPVNRTELMVLSRIRSVNTYAKCIKELDEWGYIRYWPSANRHSGSEVSCLRFDTGSDTGNDTGSHTGNNTGNDTLIKRINYAKGKQGPPQNFQNGEKRRTNGFSHYHVNNDKDYSEPL